MEQQEAQPLRSMRDVWGLITGPEASHWRRLLVQDHLGSGGRFALFRACAAGRDMVLSTAEHATIKVDTTRPQPGLQSAKVTLVTRGNLPIKLQLTAANSAHLPGVFRALEAGTTWLDGLRVWCGDIPPSTVLGDVGQRCPNLRALTLEAPAALALPSPDHFPNLRELSVYHNWSQPRLGDDRNVLLFCRIQPYVSQLTHLTIYLLGATDARCLLEHSSPCTHLHTLHLTCATLDDTLLNLILQHAPALEELAVDRIQLQSDAHVHTQHQWRQLQYSHVYVSSLARLPLSPGMELVCVHDCTHDSSTVMCDVTSMEEAVAARLRGVKYRWRTRFVGDRLSRLTLMPTGELHGDHHPAALHVALTTLPFWAADANAAPRLELDGWVMSYALLLELPGLPRWQDLRFGGGTWWLPGPLLYGTLMRLLPDSYCNIEIMCQSEMSEEAELTCTQVESICYGAPVNRTTEAPLRITLMRCAEECFEAVRARMQVQVCPFPNVEVLWDDW